jgi:hypothetical protein
MSQPRGQVFRQITQSNTNCDSKAAPHGLTELDKKRQCQLVQALDRLLHTVSKKAKRANKGVQIFPI